MSEMAKKRVVVEFTERGARVLKGSFKDVASEIKKSNGYVSDFKTAMGKAKTAVNQFKAAGEKAFSAVKKAISILTAPLRIIIGLMATLKATMVTMGLATLKAASDYETLRARLQTVLVTAAKANKAFAESRQFSIVTPFTPQQIVAVRTLLESVSIQGQDAVKAVAEASAAMKKDINDVARAVISMEVEPLRNLGIQSSRQTAGGTTTFNFEYINQAGEVIKTQIAGFRQAQQELIRILGDKFEGGLARMAKTMEGLISTLRGAWTDFLARFGDEVLPAAKVVVDDIINALNSVDLKEQGQIFADNLQKGWVGLKAAFQVGNDLVDRIKKTSEDAGFGEVILRAMSLGAGLFGDVLLATLKASIEIWKAIGNMIGAAIYEFLLNTDLPFAKGVQKNEAQRAIEGLSPQQIKDMLTTISESGKTGAERYRVGEYAVHETAKQFGIKPSRVDPFDPQQSAALDRNRLEGFVKYGNRDTLQTIIGTSGHDRISSQLTEDMATAGSNMAAISEELRQNASARLEQFGQSLAGPDGQPYSASDSFKQYYDQGMQDFSQRRTDFTPDTSTNPTADAMNQINAIEPDTTFFQTLKDEFAELKEVSGDALEGIQEGWKSWAAQAADVTTQMSAITTNALDGLAGAFNQLLMTGKADFKALALGVVQAIQQMIIKMLILKAISVATGVPVGVLAGGGGGGASGGGGSGANAFGKLLGYQFGGTFGVPHRQFGGSALTSGFMAGENGREMVIPQSAGYVVPNAATERLSNNGGGDTGVRIINVMDPSTVEDYLTSSRGEKVIINTLRNNPNLMKGLARA